MADDVGIRVLGAVNVAVVELILGPRNDLGWVVLVRVQVDKISAIVCAVYHSTSHVAMAGNKGGCAKEDSSKFGNRHFLQRTALFWEKNGKRETSVNEVHTKKRMEEGTGP